MNTEITVMNETVLKNGQSMIIRIPVPSDARDMIEYLNTVGGESDNLLFSKNEFELTVEQESAHIEKVNADPNILMIVGTVNGTIISAAQIHSPARKKIAHNCEVGISVRKEYWGKGVGTAIMGELIRHARESGTIRNISLGVKAGNSNAIGLYEKYGFRKIGVHKNYFNIDGNYDDEILMDLYLN